jgi:DNA polymerase III alpha subunit (gram-positive type)
LGREVHYVRRNFHEGMSMPWTRARFCVLDLETTGLDPKRDEIISFGAVPVDEGRVHPADAVHFLAKPRRPIAPCSVKFLASAIVTCKIRHLFRNGFRRSGPRSKADSL